MCHSIFNIVAMAALQKCKSCRRANLGLLHADNKGADQPAYLRS